MVDRRPRTKASQSVRDGGKASHALSRDEELARFGIGWRVVVVPDLADDGVYRFAEELHVGDVGAQSR